MQRAHLAFVALLSAGSASWAGQNPISLCAEATPTSLRFRMDQRPDGTPGATAAGFSVDMLTSAFGKLGRRVVFTGNLPWSRCLRLVQAGEIDYAFGAYFDEERAKVFAYSAPYSTLTPKVFFSAKRPITVKTI